MASMLSALRHKIDSHIFVKIDSNSNGNFLVLISELFFKSHKLKICVIVNTTIKMEKDVMTTPSNTLKSGFTWVELTFLNADNFLLITSNMFA